MATPNTAPEPAAVSTPATMRAIVQDAYGSADVLRPADIATPSAGEGEVLLRVHAAGVDRGTWHLLTGMPYLMRFMGFGLRRPKRRVPGLAVAGTVVAVGTSVTRLAVGDEVYGVALGSFAEYAVAKEAKLARKPANLSMEQAAAVPISGHTALQAVRVAGRVRPGQRVLVTGASGGVGTYAVQLAVADGAGVTGVCSAAKADLVRGLGASRVLDYRTDDALDGSQRYDVVVDIAGNAPTRRLRRALTERGTLVIVGGESGGRITGGFGRTLRAAALSPFVKQRLLMLVSTESGSDLEALTELIEQGSVTAAIDRTYPLEQAADALRHLERGDVRGKLVITT